MLKRYGNTQIGARQVNPFRMPISKPTRLGREHMPHFWNPTRAGVRQGPEWFQALLREIDPDLRVTWNPIRERWYVWVKAPRITNPISQGWMLLFPVQYADGSYAPLDERTIAKIHEVTLGRYGGAVKYFNRVADEMDREREQAIEDRKDAIGRSARDYYRHIIPSVGYGKSNGSKCANS